MLLFGCKGERCGLGVRGADGLARGDGERRGYKGAGRRLRGSRREGGRCCRARRASSALSGGRRTPNELRQFLRALRRPQHLRLILQEAQADLPLHHLPSPTPLRLQRLPFNPPHPSQPPAPSLPLASPRLPLPCPPAPLPLPHPHYQLHPPRPPSQGPTPDQAPPLPRRRGASGGNSNLRGWPSCWRPSGGRRRGRSRVRVVGRG